MKHTKRISYFLALLSTILLWLTACSFQLRGQNELPQPLHILYLQTDNQYGSLESTLRQTLRSSGVVLVNSADMAPVTLRLSNTSQTNNNVAIGPSSQTRVYTLNYQVVFTLLTTQNKVLVGPRLLGVSRNLTLSANQLPQSNNQIDVLNREMERDIVNQLYNILRSEQVMQALSMRR